MSQDNFIEATITKSLDGRITSWPPSAEAIFGYSRAEAIGRHVSIIIPFDYQDEEYDILDSLKHGQSVPERETIRRCKQGNLLRVNLAAEAICNSIGKIIAVKNHVRLLGEAKSPAENRSSATAKS
jgi:PAS domain S-box-containing protein